MPLSLKKIKNKYGSFSSEIDIEKAKKYHQVVFGN